MVSTTAAIVPFNTPKSKGKMMLDFTLSTNFLTNWKEMKVKNIDEKKSQYRLDNISMMIFKKVSKNISLPQL